MSVQKLRYRATQSTVAGGQARPRSPHNAVYMCPGPEWPGAFAPSYVESEQPGICAFCREPHSAHRREDG